MVDRFLAWLGTGAVLVGVSAGMLVGAGAAVAQEGSASDDGGTTTSETSDASKTTESKDNSIESTDPAGADKSDAGDSKPETPADVDDEEAVGEDADQERDAELAVVEPKGKNDSDTARTNRSAAQVKPAGTHDGGLDSDADIDAAALATNIEKSVVDTAVAPQDPVVQRKAVVIDTPTAVDTEDTAKTAAVAFAAPVDEASDATASAPPLQGLLSIIGTVVFNLYGLATAILGGPPILPANSGVTVRTSTLHLDCGCTGDGVDVQADWYAPETEEGQAPPDQLIYLQHGFLARGPWYSYTAAALAKQTNSIVVAPSITSNFLAADACWLGATPMHEAMARLFDDDNTALADSAEAAGYSFAIPDRVVLIGHSLGGGAVIGIAGAMADNETEDRLAGVIMLDGVPFDPKAAESIKKVDPDIPIYNLASPRYFWNQFGVGSDALLEARPGKFIGVTLKDGSHVDSMRGGNPLIQFGQELVAGFVRPENGDAAQILMIDWTKDMFAGVPHDPITDEFTIDTPSGEATAVPLPNSLTKPFILNPLQAFVSLGNGLFTFEPACVEQSVASCSASMAA